MGECSHGMTLHGDAMFVDLVVKCFAQADGVDGAILGRGTLGMIWGEPQVEMVKLCDVRNYVV